MPKDLTVIGRSTEVNFPELSLRAVPARIDTGARTSAIWASNVTESNGQLQFKLFGPESSLYSGQLLTFADYQQRAVANSSGVIEPRFAVRLQIVVEGRKIRAWFTLADRTAQVYPVLVGRNVLRGKFVVDVKQGTPLLEAERQRSRQLKQALNQPNKGEQS